MNVEMIKKLGDMISVYLDAFDRTGIHCVDKVDLIIGLEHLKRWSSYSGFHLELKERMDNKIKVIQQFLEPKTSILN